MLSNGLTMDTMVQDTQNYQAKRSRQNGIARLKHRIATGISIISDTFKNCH